MSALFYIERSIIPLTLSLRSDVEGAWRYYIARWRQGKPHRDTWDNFYEQAWAMVSDG
jgi:hypothetical protein